MAHKLKLIIGNAISLPLYINKTERSEAMERIFKPLLKALFNHKKILYTLFITGHLLDWCVKHRREYVQALKELIGSKRLELLGGGYYDPIFPLISREDSIAHIEHTSTTISKLYRKRPRGIWLNQLLWDSSLTSILQKYGLDYTFLPDSDSIGYDPEQRLPSTPVITEHGGKCVTVFPIHTRLCELWQSNKLRALFTELQALHAAADQNEINVITLFDSSEKQGSINTIERLLHLLDNSSDWLEIVLPSAIPDNSYALRTTHFSSQHLRSLKNNIYHNKEIASMYSAMHYQHTLVSQLKGDKQRKRFVKDLLLQSQNYYSFLVESGYVYNPQLQRKHAYGLLIEIAETVYNEKKMRPTITNLDYNFDGVKEFIFQNDKISAAIHRKGAVITEFNLIKNRWNWLDMPAISSDLGTVLPPSPLNAKKQKPQLRNCAIDYILPDNSIPRRFLNYHVHSYSLANNLYEMCKLDREQSLIGLKTLARMTHHNQNTAIEIDKRFQFQQNALTINYHLRSDGDSVCKAIFATQININPSLGHFDEIDINYFDAMTKMHPIPAKKLFLRVLEAASLNVRSTTEKRNFTLKCAGSAALFFYRLRKRNEIIIIPCWNLLLGPQDVRSLQITIILTPLSKGA